METENFGLTPISAEDISQYAGADGVGKPWFHVFSAGKYPQGDVTEADLDDLVASYNPKTEVEASCNFDHEWGGPSYGWIESVKRAGKRLLVQFSHLDGHLIEQVKLLRYKYCSPEIARNYRGSGRRYLVGLGFLGNRKPADTKHKPIRFSEEYGEVACYGIVDFTSNTYSSEETSMSYTEEQIAELEKKAGRADELEQKYAGIDLGRYSTLETENKALQDKTAKLEKQRRYDDAEKKIVAMGTRIIPAMKSGLCEFAVALDELGQEQTVEYAESEGKQAIVSLKDYFFSMLEKLPENKGLFKKTVAGKDAPVTASYGDDEGNEALHEAAVAYCEQNNLDSKTVEDYKKALEAVAK